MNFRKEVPSEVFLAYLLVDLLRGQMYGSGTGNGGHDWNGFAGIFSTTAQERRIPEPWTYENLEAVLLPWWHSTGQDRYAVGVMSPQWLREVRSSCPPLWARVGEQGYPLARMEMEMIRIGDVYCIASPHCPTTDLFVWRKEVIRVYFFGRDAEILLGWEGWQSDVEKYGEGQIEIRGNMIGIPQCCLRITGEE